MYKTEFPPSLVRRGTQDNIKLIKEGANGGKKVKGLVKEHV